MAPPQPRSATSASCRSPCASAAKSMCAATSGGVGYCSSSTLGRRHVCTPCSSPTSCFSFMGREGEGGRGRARAPGLRHVVLPANEGGTWSYRPTYLTQETAESLVPSSHRGAKGGGHILSAAADRVQQHSTQSHPPAHQPHGPNGSTLRRWWAGPRHRGRRSGRARRRRGARGSGS
eukprot:1200237-Prymnesium_polylepis.1